MIRWERLKSQADLGGPSVVYRARVPGGWFIHVIPIGESSGSFFYPDPNHIWDGVSLPQPEPDAPERAAK
jgi:hypothetical protein